MCRLLRLSRNPRFSQSRGHSNRSIRTITTLWCGNVVYSTGTTHDSKSLSSSKNEMPSINTQEGSVDISDGKIVACNPGEEWSQALERNPGAQNLGEKTVLSPGLIDVHTHISALGRNWEGYETATMAAAAGGITTLMGMPLNSLPSTTTLQAVEMEREASSSGPLYVDVGLWGGVVPENHHNIQELLESPYVFGLKAFLAPLPPAAGYQAVSPQQLKEAAKVCGPTGKLILVHSELMTEDESLGAVKDAFAKESSPRSYAAHLASRPAKWEQDAVRVVCEASRDCRMHIVHLSDARGCLPIIQECKESPENSLTVETCPHYLLLDESLIQDGEVVVKCFPPIRDKENRELLWKGLSEGIIDMVASDHSPCEPHMRNMESGDIQTAWGGLSGLQYQLQATWTDATRRNHTLDDMAKWWSEQPARLAGLERQKGRIEPGQQADLCWWDPSHLGAPNSYSKEYHRWTGTTYFANNDAMYGRVLGTWVRGQLVYDGEKDEHLEPAGAMMTC